MSETKITSDSNRRFGRRAILTIATSLALAVCPLAHAAQSLTLAWNPSAASGVAGYMIHYGNNGTAFTQAADAGTNTTWTISGLQAGDTNTFVVAAYDSLHNESPFSNQTVYYVPGALRMGVKTKIKAAASMNFPVAPGHTYKVQASTDLQHWETIWQTTATANTVVEYQDPAGANLKMRFYRTVSN